MKSSLIMIIEYIHGESFILLKNTYNRGINYYDYYYLGNFFFIFYKNFYV